MDVSDGNLLRRYRSGNVEALEVLVNRYRVPVFGFIVNMTGNLNESEEVFQEVWLRAIRGLGLYRHRNFLGWLIRIARNVVIDRSRRGKPCRSLDEQTSCGQTAKDRLKTGNANPRENVAANELGGRIATAVSGLPVEQKEVFVMRMSAGLPFKEIARIQNVSINTTLARMQYALAKLRDALREDYELLPRPEG